MGTRFAGILLLLTTWIGPRVQAQDGFAEIAARVRGGDLQGALTRLAALPAAQRKGPEGAYLRGRLLMQVGQLEQALQAFPADPGALPGRVALDLRERRAVLLSRLGRCQQAIPSLQALRDEGHRKHLMQARLGECALAGGRLPAAIAGLRAVPPGTAHVDDFAVQLSLAQALAGAGNKAEAISTLQELLRARPEHGEAPLAEAQLAALSGAVHYRFEDRLERARHLVAARRIDAALQELELAGRPPTGALRALLLHERGMALFKLRTRYAEAARVLSRAARLKGPNRVADAFHAARALSRAGHDARAVRAYRKLARTHPTSGWATTARYLAAWLSLRHGFAGAERRMRKLLAGSLLKSRPKLQREGRFHVALHAFERKRYRRARLDFERYARTAPEAMVQARGLYWAGRSAQLGRSTVEARRLFLEAIKVEPLHWYSQLSAMRLRELGVDPPHPFVGDLGGALKASEGGQRPPKTSAQQPAAVGTTLVLPADVQLFSRLGLQADAVAALRVQEAGLRSSLGKDLAPLIAAYQALGHHARPLQLLRGRLPDLLQSRPRLADRWAWRAAYAEPHAALVERLTVSEGLPSNLLHAIVRKESAYNPRVVSYADAIGLMQLLPKTAFKVAGQLGLEANREALFNPETNLRLGARYLSTLLRELDGQPLLAIAAYNAGPHRVRPWLALSARGSRKVDVDLFVERIPVDQTRNYVRRVATTWARYRYLEDPSQPWPLELPAQFSVISASRRR